MARMIISGSHGAISADMATGLVVDRGEPCGCEDCGGIAYGNIARIDPVSMAHEMGYSYNVAHPAFAETDVLAVGYWTAAGDYAEPLTVRRADRFDGHGMDFDDWVPLRLLSYREA